MAESGLVTRLINNIAQLATKGLTLVDIMLMALSRGIQPLQNRAHLMWEYNGLDDSTHTIRGWFYKGNPLREMLSLLFKGKASNFSNEHRNTGFHANLQVLEVITCPAFSIR